MRFQKTYTQYENSRHSWYKVPIKELRQLGIYEDITWYSRKRGKYAYSTSRKTATGARSGWRESR